MKSSLLIRRNLIVFLFCFIILCGVGAWSQRYNLTKPEETWNKKKAELRVDNIKVRNYTSGIEILSTEIDKKNETVTLTFKNNYESAITGYQVAIGGGVILTDCLTGAIMDQNILSGEVRKDTYALQLDIDQHGIKILAVVLDNRNTDGASESVQEIQEYRKGVKTQRKHVLQLMRNMLVRHENEPTATLNDLESKLAPFSEDEEARLPAHVRFGLQDEKVRLLRNIKSLKDMASVVQLQAYTNKEIFWDNLASLIENYTKTLDIL